MCVPVHVCVCVFLHRIGAFLRACVCDTPASEELQNMMDDFFRVTELYRKGDLLVGFRHLLNMRTCVSSTGRAEGWMPGMVAGAGFWGWLPGLVEIGRASCRERV